MHDGGWRIDLQPDRRLIVRRPNGSVAFDGSTVDVAPTGSADVDLYAAFRARVDELVAQHAAA